MKIGARLAPTDIDQVRRRQRANQRFSAYSQLTTPEFVGEVEFTSAATSTDKTSGQTYYLLAEMLADLGDLRSTARSSLFLHQR